MQHLPARGARPAGVRGKRLAAAALVAVCGGVVAAATPAAASSASRIQTVHIEGLFTPKAGSTNEWDATGDFVGTYTLLEEKVTQTWDYSTVTIKVIEGRDRMSGCVDSDGNGRCGRREPRGTVDFDFKRLAAFSPEGDFVQSNCVHPVTASEGAFSGGLVYMADRTVGDGVVSTYRGDLVVQRGR